MLKFRLKVLLSLFCVVFSCLLTVLYLYLSNDDKVSNEVIAVRLLKDSVVSEPVEVKQMDTNTEKIENKKESKEIDNNLDNNTDNKDDYDDSQIEEVVQVAQPEIVYEGMTLDALASKLDNSLKNELVGKGYLYASYSLEKGVDPYLAVAISLEETGCNYNCSTLVKSCNNVGGMVGGGCNGYLYFNTLDDGIKSFIDNIANNYVAYGLTNAELMNSKYAANPAWAANVNNYINIIKNK